MKNKISSLLIIFVVFFLISQAVFAQNQDIEQFDPSLEVQTPETTQVILDTNTVVELGSLEKEIADVNATYRSQLESYRRIEREYVIALDQYQKHKTLASIEELIRASKRAMQSRNEVLSSYFTLLRLELIEAKGIEITQKNITLAKVEAIISELAQLGQEVDAIEERIHVDVLTEKFIELDKRYKNASEEAIVLLSVGKLQAVYDKAIVIQNEIKAIDDGDAGVINQQAKNRALFEIETLLNKTLGQLRDFWRDIGSRREKDNVGTLQNGMNRQLNPIFSNLSQTISYFTEYLTL